VSGAKEDFAYVSYAIYKSYKNYKSYRNYGDYGNYKNYMIYSFEGGCSLEENVIKKSRVAGTLYGDGRGVD